MAGWLASNDPVWDIEYSLKEGKINGVIGELRIIK